MKAKVKKLGEGLLDQATAARPARPGREDAPEEGPRWFYLHGFASGPNSSKGMVLSAHYEDLGVSLERLNLRLPSMERLRVSTMVQAVRQAVGGGRDRAVLFGSSLGGLVAARAAEADPRVCALVLLAPAFRLGEKWRQQLGEEGWRRWKETGWLEVDDHAEKRRTRVDFEFIQEALRLEERSEAGPDVRVPVLVVHGRSDGVVDIEVSRRWARGKRHVKLVEVEDTHELVASLPIIMAEADAFLAPFLGNHRPRGKS